MELATNSFFLNFYLSLSKARPKPVSGKIYLLLNLHHFFMNACFFYKRKIIDQFLKKPGLPARLPKLTAAMPYGKILFKLIPWVLYKYTSTYQINFALWYW